MELLAFYAVEQGTSGGGLLGRVQRHGGDLIDALVGRKRDKPRTPGPPPKVKVVGDGTDESAKAAARVAADFHARDLPRDWAKRTGSDPASIAWFMSED